VWWEDLGWFDIANPQVTVRLTDDANGYVIADAVRFQGSSGVRIIDNGAPGYSQSGFIPYGAGYQGDEDYTAGDNTGDAATWLFDNLAPDSYRVSVTYVAQSNRATNSPYIFSALGPCAQVYRSPTFVLDLYSEPVGEQFADGSSDQDGKRDSNGNMTVDFGFWPSPLAVALASFAAEAQADHVLVTWETVSETGNTGFNLYRSASESAQGELMAFLPSQAPGGLQGFAYSVQDEAVMPGVTYWYWLEAVDIHGTATRHGPVSATYEAPMAVALTSLDTKPGPGQGETVWWLVLVVGLGWAAILPTLNRARIKRR
ncbi:MAG TPA: hypothetical protein VL334_03165, partial [Anaerolineae bacterium]|nr:hypothetical protein [Anaerolineae bacterium]